MLRRRRIGGCFAAMVARFVRHLWMEALSSFKFGGRCRQSWCSGSLSTGSVVLGRLRFPELRGSPFFSCFLGLFWVASHLLGGLYSCAARVLS